MIYAYRNEISMSVNLEVKGTLARLLAQEDLIVEHKSVETASFNVQTRVLTLPRWEKATGTVVDLLVAHEVGHALFTPNEDWRDKVNCPQGFVNVTEDVRIENLMKRRFAGLPKTFYRGYEELNSEDFFSLGDEDPNDMGIADRVNLHFKLGSFMMIKFSPEEQVVVNQIAAANTFDEALVAAEALYALHKKQQEEEQQEPVENAGGGEGEPSPSEDSGDEADDQGAENEETENQPGEPNGGEGEGESEESNESETQEVDQSPQTGGESANLQNDSVRTMDALEDKLGDLTASGSWDEPDYIEYPVLGDDVVVSPSEIYEHLHTVWSKHKDEIAEKHNIAAADMWYEKNIGCYQKKFDLFKRDIQSEVNYLVKEFECKKAATAYSRANTARTGVLDCTKLHTYKYNDDLFKKVTSLPEGKNHGLIFTLDWSGSMCNIMEDTVKQLLSLVMFCDKVNIPFKVYAFTNEWVENVEDAYGYYRRPKETYTKNNVFHIPAHFSMLNLLSSGVSRRLLYKQMADVYTLACLFNYHMGANVPGRLMLSGTPLNEAIVSLRTLLPQFKAEANVEKAHVIILTDGEAGCSIYTKSGTNSEGEYVRPKRLKWGYSTTSVYLRNRVSGTIRKFEQPTTTLITDLREQFPESSFTGFRIAERGTSFWVRQACNYDEKTMATWKKDKCVTITSQGYNKYYIVAASKLQEDTEFTVADDASKAKIKSAFAKSLKGKKTNKKILSDFIGEIV